MIEQIELAILERLRHAGELGALGYTFRTLETYPEEWDSYLKDKGAVIVAPAAWVVFAGWRMPAGGEDWARGRPLLTFFLVVMAENLRSETATRHGGPSPAEPGSYRLAVDAARLLIGQDLGLEIDSLRLGALRFVGRLPAWEKRKVSMLGLELTTAVGLASLDLDEPDQLADFTAFHANWDVEPHGNVDADPDAPGVQIPDDAGADATDHVQLEQPE